MEVFLRIHSRIDTLECDCQLKGWIFQIARNSIIDYYRAQKPIEEIPESLAQPEAEIVEQCRQEIADWLLPMILELPEKYRRALIMAEIEGACQKEVATALGISLSGAKSRIQRGRAMLREMLVQCCQFEFDRTGQVIGYRSKNKR